MEQKIKVTGKIELDEKDSVRFKSKKVLPKKFVKKKIVDSNFVLDRLPELEVELFNTMGLNITDGKKANEAFKKICSMWNDDEKSRRFLKHLMISFLPVEDNKLVEKDGKRNLSCSLLGHKLYSKETIAKQMGKIPSDICFFSPKSDKILSCEALNGLYLFEHGMINIENASIVQINKVKVFEQNNPELVAKQKKITEEKRKEYESRLIENNLGSDAINKLLILKNNMNRKSRKNGK